MRCLHTPTIFRRNVTDDEWIPSRAGMAIATECLYILVPIGVFVLLAAVPFGLPQLSWDTCLDVYGPASESTDVLRGEDRRPGATHIAKTWAAKPLNGFSSFLLFLSTLWQFFASRDRTIASERAPHIMRLRLFLLLAIPTVAVYATLNVNYGSGEGLLSIPWNCVMHVIDVVSLVFGDTQLSIETWG